MSKKFISILFMFLFAFAIFGAVNTEAGWFYCGPPLHWQYSETRNPCTDILSSGSTEPPEGIASVNPVANLRATPSDLGELELKCVEFDPTTGDFSNVPEVEISTLAPMQGSDIAINYVENGFNPENNNALVFYRNQAEGGTDSFELNADLGQISSLDGQTLYVLENEQGNTLLSTEETIPGYEGEVSIITYGVTIINIVNADDEFTKTICSDGITSFEPVTNFPEEEYIEEPIEEVVDEPVVEDIVVEEPENIVRDVSEPVDDSPSEFKTESDEEFVSTEEIHNEIKEQETFAFFGLGEITTQEAESLIVAETFGLTGIDMSASIEIQERSLMTQIMSAGGYVASLVTSLISPVDNILFASVSEVARVQEKECTDIDCTAYHKLLNELNNKKDECDDLNAQYKAKGDEFTSTTTFEGKADEASEKARKERISKELSTLNAKWGKCKAELKNINAQLAKLGNADELKKCCGSQSVVGGDAGKTEGTPDTEVKTKDKCEDVRCNDLAGEIIQMKAKLQEMKDAGRSPVASVSDDELVTPDHEYNKLDNDLQEAMKKFQECCAKSTTASKTDGETTDSGRVNVDVCAEYDDDKCTDLESERQISKKLMDEYKAKYEKAATEVGLTTEQANNLLGQNYFDVQAAVKRINVPYQTDVVNSMAFASQMYKNHKETYEKLNALAKECCDYVVGSIIDDGDGSEITGPYVGAESIKPYKTSDGTEYPLEIYEYDGAEFKVYMNKANYPAVVIYNGIRYVYSGGKHCFFDPDGNKIGCYDKLKDINSDNPSVNRIRDFCIRNL